MKRAAALVLLLFLVPTAALLLAWWLGWGPPEPAPTSDRLELLREKNVGLGYLENGEFARAAPIFARIAQALPADPLGQRNLVLARFAPNDAGASAIDDPAALAATVADASRMLEREQTAAAHQLAGRVFQKQTEMTRGKDAAARQALERARREFRQAAGLAAADPAPLFDLYLLEKELGEEDPDHLSKETLELLGRIKDRVPGNLAAQMEWLQQLADRRDPRTRAALDTTLRLLPDEQEARPGQSPRANLEEAAKLLAASPGQVPATVFPKVFAAHQALLRHPAYQQDYRRLRLHPLEFVLNDFQDGFYQDLPAERVEAPIAVAFVPMAAAPGAASFAEVIAAGNEDLLGDGVFRTVLLRGKPPDLRIETLPARGGPALAAADLSGEFTGLVLADLDLDILPGKDRNIPADLDLVAFGPSGVRVYENREAGEGREWRDRTESAGLAAVREAAWLRVFDVDADGNLDLAVGQPRGVRIFRNRGDWTFDDISGRSPDLAKLETREAVFGDFDRDADVDLLVRTADGTLLLENQRNGRFTRGKTSPLAAGAPLAALDWKNQGKLEIPALPPGLQAAAAGILDYDNDGWLDLWLSTGDAEKPLRLLRNAAGQRWEDVSALLPPIKGPLRGVFPRDLDGDGDLDLLLIEAQGLAGLRNEGGNQNRWLDLRLRAMLNRDAVGAGQAAKVNYLNIGGTIEVKAGRHDQLQMVTGSLTHFGLGGRKQADLARVLWTNGVPQAVLRPSSDQVLAEDQRPKGSCPYLYTWDGEKFVFITDCLWSSALGMQLAHGVFMPHAREENHLILPGDRLRPKGDEYLIQFTNELWEVPYLDHAELWAVDHPADVEVYSNQKVPPIPKGTFQILTVRNKRTPRSARDHRGRDVLAAIARRDGDCLGGFRRIRYVGLAEPHWLELDLGDLKGARQVTLFLTGWIWPTDTTANVAISQDGRFKGEPGEIGGLFPPSLQVPDGNGGWRTIRPNMGFPSGKMQTVAVPVAVSELAAGDRRVRIATAMEFYWDEVFFTVDEPAAEVQVRKLPVAAADLHYRGYSRIYQAAPTSPFLYDHGDVDPAPRWLPIPGPYTRYGEVAELLRQEDNRYVVMSPGDELTLRFQGLAPPGPGQKRTFVFYGNGWLKDFDMNGSASTEVGPLPFDGMTAYPYRPPERFPERLESFRREWLTRDPATEIRAKPAQPDDSQRRFQ